MKLSVGQKLWWVPAIIWLPSHLHAKGFAVEVIKISKGWATLSNNFRVDVNTLAVEPGEIEQPGVCYLNEAAYDSALVIKSELHALQNDLEQELYGNGITVSDIKQARKLLRL